MIKDGVEDRELAYIAGFIDGEGCISANSNYLGLRVAISNTVRAPLLFVQEILGGSIRRKKVGKSPQGKPYKQQWRWLIGGKSAAEALLVLLPYLIAKKEEAILGIALATAKGHDRVDIAVKLRLTKL